MKYYKYIPIIKKSQTEPLKNIGVDYQLTKDRIERRENVGI